MAEVVESNVNNSEGSLDEISLMSTDTDESTSRISRELATLSGGIPNKSATSESSSEYVVSSSRPSVGRMLINRDVLISNTILKDEPKTPVSVNSLCHRGTSDSLDSLEENSRSSKSTFDRVSISTSKELKRKSFLNSEELKEIKKKLLQASVTDGSFSEKGFLVDVERSGFLYVWNHPFLHLYFLMFLFDRNKYPLHMFYFDVQDFKSKFSKIANSQRHQRMYKIIQHFLNSSSNLCIEKYLPLVSEKDKLVFDMVLARLHVAVKNPTETMFDDIAYIVLEYLFSLCVPNFNISDSFFESAAYQSLCEDLGKAKLITNVIRDRAKFRILDFPVSILKVYSKKISSLMDKHYTDWKKDPAAGNLREMAESTKKTRNTSVVSSAVATSSASIESNGSANEDDENGATSRRHRASVSAVGLVQDSNSFNEHPFISISNVAGKFCEKCYKAFRGNAQNCVRCEACYYIAHKNCRNTVKYPCIIKREDKVEPDLLTGSIIENAEHLVQKYLSLTKELQVSLNMKNALGKIKEAHQESSPLASGKSKDKQKEKDKPTNSSADVSSQEDNLAKKINFLQQDLQSSKLELASALSSFFGKVKLVEVEAGYWKNSEVDSFVKDTYHSIPENALLKVVLPSHEDLLRASKTRKTVSVKKTISAKELVVDLVKKAIDSKLAEEWSHVDYFLSFEDFNGNERYFLDEDMPCIVPAILGEIHFYLKAKETDVDIKKNGNKKPDPPEVLAAKRKAVIAELYETEKNYVDNLQLAIKYFFLPISNSGLVPRPTMNGLFGNIQDVANLHSKVADQMKSKVTEDPENNGVFSDLLVDKLANFKTVYSTYCLNQHNSQRTLNKLKESVEFSKFLKECENRRQLSRLSLADILIQPMHRITRYPILLKRLLSYTPTEHPDNEVLRSVIKNIEEIVQEVNNLVKNKESEYRIRYLQHMIDWNGQSDVISLTQNNRKLLAEKQFVLVNGSKKANIDVLHIVLTDLILLFSYNKKKDGKEEFILLKPPIPLLEAIFESVPNIKEEGLILQNLFNIYHIDKDTYLFQSISNTDKVSWLEEMELFRYKLCLTQMSKELQYKLEFTPDEAETAQLYSKQVQPTPSILTSMLNVHISSSDAELHQEVVDQETIRKKKSVIYELNQISSSSSIDVRPKRSIFDLFAGASSSTKSLNLDRRGTISKKS